ncbi:hypothetical protein FRC06_009055 [Ceratobasidium sp. 370]|nr:hypothetical protein FRC06_009055 [Ceratobasidium sp. 370]
MLMTAQAANEQEKNETKKGRAQVWKGKAVASQLFLNPLSMEMILDCWATLWAFSSVLEKKTASKMLWPSGTALVTHFWLDLPKRMLQLLENYQQVQADRFAQIYNDAVKEFDYYMQQESLALALRILDDICLPIALHAVEQEFQDNGGIKQVISDFCVYKSTKWMYAGLKKELDLLLGNEHSSYDQVIKNIKKVRSALKVAVQPEIRQTAKDPESIDQVIKGDPVLMLINPEFVRLGSR